MITVINSTYNNFPEGYQLVTASASRNTTGAAIGGVGVLLSSFARKAVLSITYISSRIRQVTFCGNLKTTIIVTSPTNVSLWRSQRAHTNNWIQQQNLPAHNVQIVTGDFNGLDWMKQNLHTTKVQIKIVTFCWVRTGEQLCHHQHHISEKEI